MFFGGAGSACNTVSPGPRPSSVPRGILIHPAVWPQLTWAENWGAVPFEEGGPGSPSNTMWPGRDLHAKFHLDPSTVWSQYTNVTDRQTGQDRQTERTDRQTTDRWHRANRFWATVCKTVRPMLSERCLSVCPVCLSVCLSCPVCLSVTLVYCGQTVGWIKMKLGLQVGLGPEHTVLDRDPAPLPKGGQSPQFSAHVYCGQTAGWIKMPLGTDVGLGPDNIVLDGDPVPQNGAQPAFSSHVYCGQTAVCIRICMPLGME